MSSDSGIQTYLLSVTVLPQPGQQNLRRTIHRIKNTLDNVAASVQVVYKFKVSGEARVLAVLDISVNKDLEALVEAIWNLGTVDITSTPIIHYPTFAKNLGVEEELLKTPALKLEKDHLYWIVCDMEYHGKTLEEFLSIWKKEAVAVFTFRSLGAANLIPFKTLGQRQINGFVNQPEPGELDKLTFELPIILENGNNVHMSVVSSFTVSSLE